MICALEYNHRRHSPPTVVNYSRCCYKLLILWIGIIYSFAVKRDVDLIASNYSNLKAAFIEIRHIAVLHAIPSLALIKLCKMPLYILYNMCG